MSQRKISVSVYIRPLKWQQFPLIREGKPAACQNLFSFYKDKNAVENCGSMSSEISQDTLKIPL